MAIIQKVQLVSDLSGEEIAEGQGRTVQFGYDGTQYELELTNSEIGKLEKALKPYLDVARKPGGAQRRRRSSGGSTTGYDAKAVRKWAESRGLDVPARGRIPKAIIEQYQAEGN